MGGLGVVAIGDSIMNGATFRHFVTPQSWAQWLAESGGWAFTKYAQGGKTSSEVIAELLPLVGRTGYDVAAVTVGANDLLYDWDIEKFRANLNVIFDRLAVVADRIVISNMPSVFAGLPGMDRNVARRVPQANDVITERAQAWGAYVVDVTDFHGPCWLEPDRIHPTSLGLLEMGVRAGLVLGLPRTAATPETTRRYRAAYRVRVVKEIARLCAKRALGRAPSIRARGRGAAT